MLMYQMSERRCKATVRYLEANANKRPVQAFYEVDLRVEGDVYRLSLQPGKRRRIAVLQALKIIGEGDEVYRMIQDGALLHGLMELWLERAGL